jgi:DNA mismatch repair ATPase MutS
MIRKALHPEYYHPHNPGPNPHDQDELLGVDHIDHCVDAIRQSLMCTADVSVLVWRWNKKRQQNMEVGQIAHTCRNFEKIQAWAKERAVYSGFDEWFREPNDPLDSDTWVGGFQG